MLRLSGADGNDGGVLSAVMHSGWPDIHCSPANQAFVAAADPLVVGSLVERIRDLQLLLDTERLENSRLEEELERLRPAAPADTPSGGYFMVLPIENTFSTLPIEINDKGLGNHCPGGGEDWSAGPACAPLNEDWQ